MKRVYETIALEHLKRGHEMLFLAGPRQVGKTTVAEALEAHFAQSHYLNWDTVETKELIAKGNRSLGEFLKLDIAQNDKPLIIFDEVHKYSDWKNFLKGFYDLYKDNAHIIVTGSSRLDVYQKGGDSLMGRYFPYRMHPFSVAECLNTTLPQEKPHSAQQISEDIFSALWEFGGFPAPFLKADKRYQTQWHNLRHKQLFQEDIKDLTQIQEVGQMEMLAIMLKEQASKLMSRNNLANKLCVSNQTIHRWVQALESFYYVFTLKPWSKNISRSLIKEPKVYLWDWSNIDDIGSRSENFVACHLLKAAQIWTDMGYGNHEVYYLRTKEKREADLLMVKEGKPWFLVEVKYTDNNSISKDLYYFQEKVQAPHAFQVIIDMPYTDTDCFQYKQPIKVPARTFLSQLL